MWRTLLRPDVLFTVACAQALSPYLFWQFGLGEFKGQSGLSYVPVLIWVCGYAAFMIGTLIPRIRTPYEPQFSIAANQAVIQWSAVVVMVVICVQLALVVQAYGGIPILSYLRGDGAINIGTAVQLQEESGVGVIGSVYVTTALLHGLVLLLMICNLETGRRNQLLILLCFVVLIAAHAINGKRQGFVRCAAFLMTGLSIYVSSPVEALARISPLVRTKAAAWVVIGLTAVLLFLSFGYLAYVRNQGNYKRDSLEEIITYQEYSLLNFEVQCAEVGTGPYRQNLLYPMRRLVPWKWIEAAGLTMPLPNKYEPWAPAGLYEDLQWSVGLPGILIFSFLLGVSAMWCYRCALKNVFALLAYCQLAFSIILAHSFNEFLSLSWIPAPLILFLLLRSILTVSRPEPDYAPSVA